MRPVVSMINTAEYHLAKYLDKLIKPHMSSNYMLDSTSSFLTHLKDFIFKPSDILISFDVVSLFTNVPLSETIHLIADRLYSSDSKPPFEKPVFIKLMTIATSGIFLYQDKYYRQTDGVTMGSPLGPTMANFCLGHFEEKLLHNKSNSSFTPALYLRYADDVFCVFRLGVPHENFLNSLNNMHSNLRFTSEIGPSEISFLDTFISLPTTEGGSFTSRVFRKSTFTGLMLHYSAVCPSKWKFGLIRCLVHRAYVISSTWQMFSREIDYLKGIFLRNGYPESVFSSCVKRFLDSKFSDKTSSNITDDKVETIFLVPYIGVPSVIFGRKIRDIFKKYYCIDVKIVFTSFKVKNYFSLKCRAPLPLLANVVYKFTCLRDANTTYIGKTMRHLVTRVKEHGTSSSTSSSAIRDHLQSCEPCKSSYSCDSFSIICSGRNDNEISIKEALHIKYRKPKLNRQLYTQGSSFVLNIF